MGPNFFKVPSKFLFISWICWFFLVINMWGVLSTSPATNIDDENLENKPYFCFDLLANLEDILRPVDAR